LFVGTPLHKCGDTFQTNTPNKVSKRVTVVLYNDFFQVQRTFGIHLKLGQLT
jgi:hypothetical protein